MADINEVLRDLINNVTQRPEWDQQTGKEQQMVIAYFTTPHGFDGQEKMTKAEWTDPETRNQKLMQAIIDLEGPFWESGEKPKKGK